MKKVLFVILIGISVLLSACSTIEDDTPSRTMDPIDKTPVQEEDDLLQLTMEELSIYDGKDGMDAYIAVDGKIYDVTGVSAWTGGTHNGNMAGTDVSDVIQNAPHGYSVLDDLEIIGELID